MTEIILALIVILGIPLGLALGSIGLTRRSVPDSRHARVERPYLVRASVLSLFAIVLMVLIAWFTHEDVHYYGFGKALYMLGAMIGGGLLLLGLGPFTPWLLGELGRFAVRLSPPIRLAALDIAGNRRRTAPMVAATMISTALAITLLITTSATIAQSRAEYQFQAPTDWLIYVAVAVAIALLVALFAPGRTAAASRSRRVL
ncbi:hypothetical protein [Sinosporangium siamense]|uniref:Uncharacterized protein n=1 Tax=Sinosporangium siamense TaxID=1367973 RepID=A0A919V8N4_9ACTN|nr:hypothetical protein [Sinosporangium siamense]GII93422.1 hypothetical protein Ssi02_36530 [Sinosporangium siamense]